MDYPQPRQELWSKVVRDNHGREVLEMLTQRRKVGRFRVIVLALVKGWEHVHSSRHGLDGQYWELIHTPSAQPRDAPLQTVGVLDLRFVA
jgi:hypothetical protein